MNGSARNAGMQRTDHRWRKWHAYERVVCVSIALFLLAGCAPQVRFPSAHPKSSVMLYATLYRPEGSGPYPAVVLSHTCAGVQPHVLRWAEWLKGEGFVALVVDSFSPRGESNICGGRGTISVDDVALDAVGALAYLRTLPFVDPGRIAMMGWSYGAMAATRVTNNSFVKAVNPPGGGFRAAVAFYPGCGYVTKDISIPLLLLLGEADDYTPPEFCIKVAKQLQEVGRPVSLVVYPGTRHGFDDAELRGTVYTPQGSVGFDPAATADAKKRARAFLKQYVRQVP